MKSEGKRKITALKIWIVIGVIILGTYVVVALYFGKCFFPQTVINGIDFGYATGEETAVALKDQLHGYSLEVKGRDLKTGEETLLFEITGRDVNLRSDIDEKEVKELLKNQNNFIWPVCIGRKYDYQLQGGNSFDAEKLSFLLMEQDAFREECTIPPQDAYIQGYSSLTGKYDIIKEVEGTRLDCAKAEAVICTAIANGMKTINLEAENCYLQPKVSIEDSSMQEAMSKVDKMLEAEITYDWNGNELILDADIIKDWIILKDGAFTVDEAMVTTFVEENAAKCDTYGKHRAFRTTLGYDLTLPSGSFGWLTDQEAETKALIALIEDGAVTVREPVYASKAPWKGINDIGNSYVEADLTHQHLYLYQKGTLVFETDFVSGDMSKGYNTPQGVFGVTYKTTNAILRGADYQENVTYWMPYEGNYGMHDASWRDSFGGDIFLADGSHGCLNLPLDAAAVIYSQVSEGFPVICYYYPESVLPAPEAPPVEEDDDEDD